LRTRYDIKWCLRIGGAVIVIALAGLLPEPPALAWAEPRPAFQIIVNQANPASSITAEQVSRLMLKKVTSWADGTNVEPVDLPGDSPLRRDFNQVVHHRDGHAIKTYWNLLIFSGREVPPPIVQSDADVVALVASHPGAIGYVGLDTPLDDRVRPLTLLGTEP
jgi:hypothetical protein